MGFFIKISDKAKILFVFLTPSSNFMRITLFIIKFTPYGIFGIVAKQIAENNDLGNSFRVLVYLLVVILALFIMRLLYCRSC